MKKVTYLAFMLTFLGGTTVDLRALPGGNLDDFPPLQLPAKQVQVQIAEEDDRTSETSTVTSPPAEKQVLTEEEESALIPVTSPKKEEKVLTKEKSSNPPDVFSLGYKRVAGTIVRIFLSV